MKKSLLRFIGVFIFLYLVFRTMLVLVSVRMTGWQFIVFIIVLIIWFARYVSTGMYGR